MGRVEINKKNKENMLYKKGFQLFVDKGFVKTTISDIVKAAGLAKGTFYLYFKDKYELRDKLIVQKSSQIMNRAIAKLEKEHISGFEPRLIFIIDQILKEFSANTMLLKFIKKNLSWGVFREAFYRESQDHRGSVYSNYLQMMENDGVICEKPELMLYTIMELVSSTSYSCILFQSPVGLDEYLPYLHESIHQILKVFTREA